jgi:serine/threonine protein kinase
VHEVTSTFHAGRFQPPAVIGSGSRASGQVIRSLNDWIEHNREAIDVGDYKLLRSIGTGAFGTVWEAHNFETGEYVAIKFLSAGDLKWEAMLAEVKFLQAMEGAGGIVSVKQVRRGTPSQPPYYVMPKANGGSLADWIEQRQKQKLEPGSAAAKASTAEVIRIFTRVTAALAAVHRRGIHHCDLKPRNILLHSVHDGDRPDPLIADFGQAHLATDDTPALGTFFYMPPDQAETALKRSEVEAAVQESQPAQAEITLQRTGSDSSWDVYALGAVLFEMLTGEPPRKSDDLLKEIKGTNHLETKLNAYRDGVLSASEPTGHRKLVDPLLAKVIDRCLSLNPAERPRDAGEVAALLKHRSWWRHFKPLMIRAGIITLSLIMLIAMLSLVVSQWMYDRTKDEVSQDVRSNLVQAAWYGKQVIEDRLQNDVAFVEAAARSKRAPRRELADTAKRYPAKPDFAIDQVPDRTPFDDWLKELYTQLEARWGPNTPTLTLVVCCGDPGYGYIISRIQSDGELRDEGTTAAEKADADKLFTTSFAFRDYYNGNGDQDHNGQYSPIRRTHISQTYHSIVGTKPWRMEIATPVWYGEKPGEEKVVGILRLGINVKESLARQLYVDRQHLPEHSRAADGFDVILVDNRDHWVYHRKGMEFLAKVEDETGTRPNPHNYRDLIESNPQLKPGGVARHAPWKTEAGDFWQGEYVDPIEIATGNPRREAFACAVRLQPYALSTEAGRDGDRRWTLVVEMDKETALGPVSDLRVNMFLAGAILVVALSALAIVLWIWLFRLLRGWEFAAHG